jgi:hypothetical protein
MFMPPDAIRVHFLASAAGATASVATSTANSSPERVTPAFAIEG